MSGPALAESLLMSGKYSSIYGAINIPVVDNVVGTGFIEATGTGTKKTIVVPQGIFVGGAALFGGLTIPIPGNPQVQQLATSWNVQAPAPTSGDRSLAVGLTPMRPNANFTWCPGMTVAACGDVRDSANGAPPGSGTVHGLVQYTAGGLFSGTMSIFLAGPGTLSSVIGLTPRFLHSPVGAAGPRIFGGQYGARTSVTGPSAVVTTGASLGGTTPSGGIITQPGTIITVYEGQLSQANFGMPLTTGTVYVQHTAGFGTITTLTGVGSHNTIKGRGNITMVSSGFGSNVEGGVGGFPAVIVLTMDIATSQLTPALSPLGLVAIAGLFLSAGGYMLRRSLAQQA